MILMCYIHVKMLMHLPLAPPPPILCQVDVPRDPKMDARQNAAAQRLLKVAWRAATVVFFLAADGRLVKFAARVGIVMIKGYKRWVVECLTFFDPRKGGVDL